eukprot:CFRG5891T1
MLRCALSNARNRWATASTMCSVAQKSERCIHYIGDNDGGSIPLIDLGGLFKEEYTTDVKDKERQRICSQIRRASKEVGFFYLVNHGVMPELIKSTYSSMKDFFSLPEKEKMKVHVNRHEGLRGYSAEYEQGNYGVDVTDIRHQESLSLQGERQESPMDFKQTYHMGRELPSTHKNYNATLFAPNVYPPVPSHFKENTCAYWNSMMALSDTLFEIFAESLHLDRSFFKDNVNEGMDSMNINYYLPFDGANRDQMGIGSHTDYECFTLLSMDGPTALQIYSPQQQAWVYVPEVPSALVVNIGDMMARWSNDELLSTVHRVVPPASPRASIAFFRCCNFDTVIECLDPNSNAKYPPIEAGHHMLARIGEASSGLDIGAAQSILRIPMKFYYTGLLTTRPVLPHGYVIKPEYYLGSEFVMVTKKEMFTL